MRKNQKKTEENENISQERRKLIIKAAYIAPTLVVLGTLSPITANAQSDCGPLPCPPGPPGEQIL